MIICIHVCSSSFSPHLRSISSLRHPNCTDSTVTAALMYSKGPPNSRPVINNQNHDQNFQTLTSHKPYTLNSYAQQAAHGQSRYQTKPPHRNQSGLVCPVPLKSCAHSAISCSAVSALVKLPLALQVCLTEPQLSFYSVHDYNRSVKKLTSQHFFPFIIPHYRLRRSFGEASRLIWNE